MGRLAVFHTVFILGSTNLHHNREPKTKAKCYIRGSFPPEKIPTLGSILSSGCTSIISIIVNGSYTCITPITANGS